MTLRRAGRAGLVLLALTAFVQFLLPWFAGDDGEVVIGLDLTYVEAELPEPANPLTQYFLEVAPLPAYVALLLAGTVAARRRWARIVAVVVVVLAAALAVVAAVGLLSAVEDYWEPYEAVRFQIYAVVTGGLAVLLLAGAGVLAAGLRRAYDGLVAGLLVAFAAFQMVGVGLLAGEGVGASMTAVPWLAGAAYLAAAVCAVLAAVGSASGDRTDDAAPAPPPPLVRA
ncbi:hypothetical protein ACN26Y_02330 [Micromonospora sp. WMMD558]|uniref:hypothetical protein n=1 Tax=Micromonospora sp. WMMD558 TaxID=3403462 RepID=UPI003BF59666